MTDAIVVVLLLVTAVIVLITAISAHFRRMERDKYYAAAGSIVREDYLNYSLKNLMYAAPGDAEPKSARIMIYIKYQNKGQKNSFVFDPEKKIYIGRDNEKSNIYIDDVLVSKSHCCIYADGNSVFLQDMYASNGTTVRRSLFNRFTIVNGTRIALESGDRISVGSSTFKITLFYFDITKM